MVAIKTHQAAAYLKALDRSIVAILLYGPDAGLVSERGLQVAKSIAARESPPGETLRFDDSDVESDPDRLAIELRTMPMFAGRNVVRVTPGRRINTQMLKPLVDDGNLAGFLIVEAGNLRPDDGLRLLFEKARSAVAVACYPDEARDLDAMVREVLAEQGLKISSAAMQLLLVRLGADRALSRGEIEKLALFAHGRGAIDVEDVEAIAGDASELTIDRIVLAAAAGNVASALRECDRAISSGESAQTIILMLQRHFLRLHRIRCAMDSGRSLDDAVRQFRPPLHFRAKDAMAAGCRLWTEARLRQALVLIATAARAARLGGELETVLAERVLAEIAGKVAPEPERCSPSRAKG